jgi:ribosomal protein S11
MPVIILMVGGAGFFAYTTLKANFGDPSCRATALGRSVTFSPEQSANAATITALALKRDLPPRAATIANATAIVESKLQNLKFGDLDSLGLFQQRPSQGWGTQAQILDPVHATNAFYDALVKINGYQSMPIAQVAQDVQHSGFPQAYAGHEQEGRILASTLSGVSPGGFGCRLDAATVSTPAATIAAQLTAELGVPATVEAGSVHVTGPDPQQAWAAGSWAVAHADAQGIAAVTVGDRTWTRARGEDGWSWHAASTPIASTAVTIARH